MWVYVTGHRTHSIWDFPDSWTHTENAIRRRVPPPLSLPQNEHGLPLQIQSLMPELTSSSETSPTGGRGLDAGAATSPLGHPYKHDLHLARHGVARTSRIPVRYVPSFGTVLHTDTLCVPEVQTLRSTHQ